MEITELLSWLWRASWQASVLVLLVLFVQWVFRVRLAPKWRYALWFLVVARLMLPVVPESAVSVYHFAHVEGMERFRGMEQADAMAVGSNDGLDGEPGLSRERFGGAGSDGEPDERAFEPGETDPVAAGAESSSGGSDASVGAGSAEESAWNPVPVLFYVWLGGVVVFGLRLAWGNWRFARRLRGERRVTDEKVLRMLERCRKEMGVRRAVELIETAEVEGPALFGLFRLRLLMPKGIFSRFSSEELRYVFLHELAHIRRGDVSMNWLIAVLQGMHWFNPVLWFGFRRMRADRELACDALALTRLAEGENRRYGETILKLLERFSQPAAVPGLVGIVEGKGQMKLRMRSIAEFRNRRGWSVLAAGLFGVLAVGFLTEPPSDAAAEEAAAGSGSIGPGVGGILVDEDGAPVEGAKVDIELARYTSPNVRSPVIRSGTMVVTTDSSGRWTATGVPENFENLTMDVTHPDFAPLRFSTDRHEVRGAYWVRLPMDDLAAGEARMVLRKGHLIEGQVVDDDGEAIEGAEVSLGDSIYYGARQTVFTEADGRFAFRLGERLSAKIFVRKRGHGPAVKEFDLASDPDFMDIVLPPGRDLSVRVVDEDGEPIPDVLIAPDEWNGHRIFDLRGRTDSEGRYTWDSAPQGEVKFSILASGFRDLRKYPLTAGEENVVTMTAAPEITGRVVDAGTGEPVPSFQVSLGVYRGEGSISWGRERPFFVAGGEFTFPAGDPSPGSILRVEAEGYLPAHSEYFDLPEGSRAFEFALEETEQLRGTVHLPDGEPVAGVEVALLTPNSRAVLGQREFARRPQGVTGGGDFTETDDEGRFALSPDPLAGEIVFVHERGYAEVGKDDFSSLDRVYLQPWGEVEGVMMIGGEPNAGRGVFLGSLYMADHVFMSYDREAFRARTDEDGRFAIASVPPGARSIHASIRTGPERSSYSHSTPVEVRAGEVTRVQIGGAGRPVIGRFVVDDPQREVDWQAGSPRLTTDRARIPAGLGARDEYLEWSRSEEVRRARQERRSYAVVVEPDGAFRAEDVPAGEYELTVSLYEPAESVLTRGQPIGSITRDVVVPEAANANDRAPLVLGEIVANPDAQSPR